MQCATFMDHYASIVGFPDSSVGKESACNAGEPSLIPGSGISAGEGIAYPLQHSWASLVAQLVKSICLPCRRPGFDPWVGKIPWRRERLPTPVLWPGEFHGLYSPWGHKELDTTEQLSLSLGKPRFHRWVRKIPWRREWLPTPVFQPGEFQVAKSQTQLSNFHTFLYSCIQTQLHMCTYIVFMYVHTYTLIYKRQRRKGKI